MPAEACSPELVATLERAGRVVELDEVRASANPVVQLITDVADTIAGPFGLQDGVFTFSGADATSKNALANWGVAALLYLILGRVLAGVIAPRRGR